MKDLFPECENCIKRKLNDLLQRIGNATGTTPEQLRSKSRKRMYDYPRFIYYKLSREVYKEFSETEIGSSINRSRYMVKHGINRIEEVREAKEYYEEIVGELGI
jgi:chromosomal replication initiation ATPase DnaA